MRAGFLIILFSFLITGLYSQNFNYPTTKKSDVKDDYHGVLIPDPFRWLEDDNSPETEAWVKSQVDFTESYLSKIPFRDKIRKRLTELWNYEKMGIPYRAGDNYVYSRNEGLQQQSVYYIRPAAGGEAKVLLDPNKLSDDGTTSVTQISFSGNNEYMGYGISKGGSDWNEFFVLDVKSGKLLPDHIKWVKFSSISWAGNGFFYSRYDAPAENEELKAENNFHRLYYHKLGTPQSEDQFIFSVKDSPKSIVYGGVSENEDYLFIYVNEATYPHSKLWYKDLKNGKDIKPVIDEYFTSTSVIDVHEGKFVCVSDYNAANKRIVIIDPSNPAKENWKELVPEGKFVIEDAFTAGGKLFIHYLQDAYSKIQVYELTGKKTAEMALPGIGSASGFSGKMKNNELFYGFTSFTQPYTIYRYDVEKNKSEVFFAPDIPVDVSQFVTEQVFYTSKDGTKIPLFLVYKKGFVKDGKAPAMLYGYGGFRVSMTPSFRLSAIPLLEKGGVYAMACLRGGSEYGEEWHQAGMLDKKQNVFDDFIYAAEYLIKNGYTSPEYLAINGGSNGGLLVGACLLQRPDLFRVAIPQVGVLDMLRYQKFTIGWAWVSEYGSSENKDQFRFLIDYSPLHNVKTNTRYPATFITTADHDDRVFPAHSFKFAAELQDKYKGPDPILIRIETNAGHGAGISTSKRIDEITDILSFAFFSMGLEY